MQLLRKSHCICGGSRRSFWMPLGTTTSPPAFSTPPLQTPHPCIVIHHLRWKPLLEGTEANQTMAIATIAHRIDLMMIHVQGDSISVCYDGDQIGLT